MAARSGPADTWGFEDDVCSWLQPRLRRSVGQLPRLGGRGDRFINASYKQWGGMIQNDITDALKYAIDACWQTRTGYVCTAPASAAIRR